MGDQCGTVTRMAVSLRANTSSAFELVDDSSDVCEGGTPTGGLAGDAILGIDGRQKGREREENDMMGVHLWSTL